MGCSRKNDKQYFLYGIITILFWGCLLQSSVTWGKERVSYTSVTIQLKDEDTGEVFDTHVHPWQRTGKRYTYYMEDTLYKEGRGYYMYDPQHAGQTPEIAELSQNGKDNVIVLYYKRYPIQKSERAVTIFYKDAGTEETFFTEQKVLDEEMEGRYYAAEMEYCITDSDGKTYLYDTQNRKNVPAVRVQKNALQNRIVLYYRQEEPKEGETAAAVYYKEGDRIWEKSYISGLNTGEEYSCAGDEDVLYRVNQRHYQDYEFFLLEEDSRLTIQKLSGNPEENVIELRFEVLPPLTGVPPEWVAVQVPVRLNDADTKTVLKEETGTAPFDEIYDHRPAQKFIASGGQAYELDNTNGENILWTDTHDWDKVWNPAAHAVLTVARNGIKAYYRPIKQPDDAAEISVNYLDAATGQVIRTESLSGKRTGQGYRHIPENTMRWNGISYTFDSENAGNVLQLECLSGHPDIDQIALYYTKTEQPDLIQKTGAIIRLMDASTGQTVKTELIRNLIAGEAFTYRPESSFSADGQVYVWDSANPGQSLEIAALDAGIQKNVISVYYTRQELPKGEQSGEEQSGKEVSEKEPPEEELPREKRVKTERVSLYKPVKLAGGRWKLKWKKVSGAKGYQIIYAYNKRFQKAVKKTSVKNTILLKKLKKGRICYVKVRAWQMDSSGHKVYGKYSKTRRIVIG